MSDDARRRLEALARQIADATAQAERLSAEVRTRLEAQAGGEAAPPDDEPPPPESEP